MRILVDSLVGYGADGNGEQEKLTIRDRPSSGLDSPRPTRPNVLVDAIQGCSFLYVSVSNDTFFYQGKALKLPPGAFITKDGTDPRINGSSSQVFSVSGHPRAEGPSVRCVSDTIVGP